MVSPRKKLNIKAETPVIDKRRSRSRVPQVFKPYKFYLDLKGKSTSLVEDITSLGGVRT